MTTPRAIARRERTSPVATYLARLAPGSQRPVRNLLDHIAQRLGFADAEACPWEELRYAQTAAVRAGLVAHGYAPATVNSNLAALRGVLRECLRLGLMDREDYAHAVDVASVRNPHPHRGREIAASEIAALLASCGADDSPQGARDGAMLAILIGCGPRRAELVALDYRDYDRAAATLLVRHGKGNKERVLHVQTSAVPWLERWLAKRGDAHGPLFWPATTRTRGVVPGRRISASTVYHTLWLRAQDAGLEHVEPHDLRRTFATNLLREHVDIAAVSRLMGHATLDATAIYDYRSADEDRAIVEQHVHIPRMGE